MKKWAKLTAPAIGVLLVMVFLGCTETGLGEPQGSGEKEILLFSISGERGVIDQAAGTISVLVGADARLESLSPTIRVSEGASVSPGSRSARNFTAPVTYTVTAEDGTTKQYEVTVSRRSLPEPVLLLEAITITPPGQTQYMKGQAFDSTGLTVKGVYSDGSTADITEYTLYGNDTSTVGDKTVTVTAEGKTAQFRISVRDKVLVSIAVSAGPTKTSYARGYSVESAGLVITGTFDDGSTETLSGWSLLNTATITDPVGQKTVTVRLNGLTAEFTVTVTAAELINAAITRNPSKLVYTAAEEFDGAGLVVTGYYSDGSTQVLEHAITPGAKADGVWTIAVSAGGRSLGFTVLVTDSALEDIRITTLPTIRNYRKGEALNLAGLVVEGEFADGSTSNRVPYTVSGIGTRAEGTNTMTVSVNGLSDTFDINVGPARLNSISVYQYPAKLHYAAGETYNFAGLSVMGNFTDGARLLSPGQYTLNPLSGTALAAGYGTKTVTIQENYSVGLNLGDATRITTFTVWLDTLALDYEDGIGGSIGLDTTEGIAILREPLDGGFEGALSWSGAGGKATGLDLWIDTTNVDEFTWYIDGTIVEEGWANPDQNMAGIQIDANDYTLSSNTGHVVTVTAKKNGKYYSAQLTFKVEG
jgi:hypothetical protein